jgi:hypothetical protein
MPQESTLGDGPNVGGNRTIAHVCAPSPSGHFEDARMIGCLDREVAANRRSLLGCARPVRAAAGSAGLCGWQLA